MVRHHLPSFPTSFIGRTEEIAELSQLLDNPDCRLLTLVGPGGIGKTRLAVEVARYKLGDFPDGVYFVPLAPILSVDHVITAIAQILGFQFLSTGSPRQQLLDYLHSHHLLFVFDNYEHLINDVDLVVDILNEVSTIKVLVTSREVLNLSEEWVRIVRGMPFPKHNETVTGEPYSALQLFEERVKRVRGDFQLINELGKVVRICQLVEGMPLALEMAASWCHVLSCTDIVTRLEIGSGFLTIKHQNVEKRHYSIQTVFDQSWHLLSETEQTIFAKLSVFRGGFTAAAAYEVTGASLSTLASLVDKSFVRMDSPGRYDTHELLRQYAAGQLETNSDTQKDCISRHCGYYAQFVEERVFQIAYGDHQVVVVEIDNLRAAWMWAVEQQMFAEVAKMVEGFAWLYLYRLCWLHECRTLFERASVVLASTNPKNMREAIYGHVLTVRSRIEWDSLRYAQSDVLGRQGLDLLRRPGVPKLMLVSGLSLATFHNFDEERQSKKECLAILRELDELWRLGHCLYHLGASYVPDINQAEVYLQEALSIGRTINNAVLIGSSLMRLGELSYRSGNFKQARHFLEDALELLGMSYPLRHIHCQWLLGVVELQEGQYAASEKRFQDSLNAAKSIGAKVNILFNLGGLAVLKSVAGHHVEAQQIGEECLEMQSANANREGIAGTYVTLGYLATERGEFEEAVYLYMQALNKGREIGILAITLEVVMGFANLRAKSGELEWATELLALGMAHAWDTQGGLERKHLYQKLRDQLEATLEPSVFRAAWARGEKLDLETTVNQLIARNATPDQAETIAANLRLSDPLTAREMEVLALVAAGRSNRQIADELVISVNTVKRYVYDICQKLDAQNRTEAANRARTLNLLL